MKRILVLLCAALLLAACHDASQDPVIKGYRIDQVGGMSLSGDGVTVNLNLALAPPPPTPSRCSTPSCTRAPRPLLSPKR